MNKDEGVPTIRLRINATVCESAGEFDRRPGHPQMGPRALRCRPRAVARYAWAYSGATPFGDGPVGSLWVFASR